MERKLVFISSDYRKLYKDDIFRTLALPSNSIIKFRYKYEHMSDEIMIKLHELQGKEGIIFYKFADKIESIREVKIREIEKKDNLGEVFFYLQLDDFARYKINENHISTMKYVSEINVENLNVNNWCEIVRGVSESYQNKIFFNIKSLVDKNGKSIECKYDKIKKRSYYELEEENEYIMETIFYNIDDNAKGSLKIESCEKYCSISDNYVVAIHGSSDSENISLITHSLNIRQISNPIYIYEEPKETNCIVKLDVKIVRKANKAFWLAIGTALASYSIYFGQYITKTNWDCVNWIVPILMLFLPSILAGGAAILLYNKLNKK